MTTPWHLRPDYLFSKRLYVRVGKARISVLRADNGETFSDAPLVAVREKGGERHVEAIGESVRGTDSDSLTVINPFDHKRLFVSEFEIAEALLSFAVATVMKWGTMRRPIMLVHPIHDYGEPLTEIEHRVLLEIAFAAGAVGAHLHEGPDLSVDEVLAFPVSQLVHCPR